MGRDLELQCRCGEVQGWVRDVSPSTVTRAVCYCDDCQAFLHYLERADLLDARGGSDLALVAARTVQFDRGTENIEALRLSPRGSLRSYARCCKTPLGSTGTRLPSAVGFVYEAFREARDAPRRDELMGPVQGTVFGAYALGGPPPGSKRLDLGFMAGALVRLVSWTLRGDAQAHPYFERDRRTPRYPVKTITREERQALRAKCGPHPTA